MRLVLASNNAGKLAELRDLFAGLPVELVAQGALGLNEAEEPHHSFVENALAKARHAAHESGMAAIADDSGLCVDALHGAPGVVSSHYAGPVPPQAHREQQRALQDAANNRLLAQRMSDHADRRARFVCTLVALRHAQDPEPLIAFGRWHGELLREPRGASGFGYDPLLFIPALGGTVAELSPQTKNAHSHRALAAMQMVVLMRETWRLGETA
jgi:XTP/dITP diphosphohydrolase